MIGAVLIPGAKTPHLITKDVLKFMRKGSWPSTKADVSKSLILPFMQNLSAKWMESTLLRCKHLRCCTLYFYPRFNKYHLVINRRFELYIKSHRSFDNFIVNVLSAISIEKNRSMPLLGFFYMYSM